MIIGGIDSSLRGLDADDKETERVLAICNGVRAEKGSLQISRESSFENKTSVHHDSIDRQL